MQFAACRQPSLCLQRCSVCNKSTRDMLQHLLMHQRISDEYLCSSPSSQASSSLSRSMSTVSALAITKVFFNQSTTATIIGLVYICFPPCVLCSTVAYHTLMSVWRLGMGASSQTGRRYAAEAKGCVAIRQPLSIQTDILDRQAMEGSNMVLKDHTHLLNLMML